jgi:hypothetical protein
MTGLVEHAAAMTTPSQIQSSRRYDGSRLVLTVVLWLSVAATSLTAAGLGWFQVSFQLFGVDAGRGDYAMAAGIYGFGAFLLALTPAVALLFRLPLGSSLAAAAGLAVLMLLAAHAADRAAAIPAGSVGDEPWTEGAMFLALVPWVWVSPVLVLAGLLTGVGSGSWDSPSTSAT